MRINEIFYSIQGEGLLIGHPTVFVRLFGCDLRCTWCDTMYAVEGSDFTVMSHADIINEIAKYSCKTVCITGGEPLLQEKELVPLTETLLKDGYYIILETSGHRPPPKVFQDNSCLVSMDCKCPSSGMHNRMDFKEFEKLQPKDQLKFVVQDTNDYTYAKDVLKNHKITASIIFQPVHGENTLWLAESILKDNLNSVRVLPQLHKILWGNRKGV